MASVNTLILALSVSLPVALCQHHDSSHDAYKPSNNTPDDDPGHNAHQETVIFACLGAVVVMAIIIVALLWFFVDRTKDTIRTIERLLPDIIEKMKNDEERGTGAGHLSGTFDAKSEFEAGFKGSADFIDATDDRVKLTSYSKKDDTVTTVVTVDGTNSTGLTSYTRKLSNGDLPRYHNHEAATHLPSYTQTDHQVRTVADIDGPMATRQMASSPRIKADVSVVTARPSKPGMAGGGYYKPTSPNQYNGYSPNHISGNSHHQSRGRHDGQYRLGQTHTPPVSPKDPEKAELGMLNGGAILPYSEPPAYDNAAVSIDKRATLPVTTAPCSTDKQRIESEEDKSEKKKRRASFYVESHV